MKKYLTIYDGGSTACHMVHSAVLSSAPGMKSYKQNKGGGPVSFLGPEQSTTDWLS